MAKKAQVTLEVLLKSAGIKATTQQLEKLQEELKDVAMGENQVTKATKKTTKATKEYAQATRNLTKEQNKAVRAHKGTAQETGRQGKDFSRMAQGMGGLVQVYATIVGNVYALSTAFLVLRNAADLSSMMKSAEDYSNRFGRSVTNITKSLQEVTGGALSFAEALPNVNKAIAGSFSTEKIEQLAIAATKASQTFGGTANEALGRFISAAQRGRTEIVQTLGIVIQTEKVYEAYAASIGKAKDELNAFDKQQAISNAIIEESKNIFEGVEIDPNPFTQLGTTIVDLKDVMLTFVTDVLTPLVNLFNKSKLVALSFMGAIAAMIGRKLLPAVNDMTAAAAKAGIESSRGAKKAFLIAKDAARAAVAEQAKVRRGSALKSNKSIEKDFQAHLNRKVKANTIFNNTVFDDQGKLNTKLLAKQKAQIAKEANLRRSGIRKGRLKIFQGVSDQEILAMDNFYKRISVGAFKSIKANKEAAKAAEDLSTKFSVAGKRGSAAMALLSARAIGFKSQVKSGFASVMKSAQDDFPRALRKTGKTYKRFAMGIITGNATIGQSFVKLGAVVGKTGGLMAGALIRLSAWLGPAMIAITLGTMAWTKWGDAIRGITPELRKFLDIQKELPKALEEITTRTDEYLVSLEGKTPQTLKELSAALDFTTGSFMSINEELNKFSGALRKALGADSIGEAEAEIDSLEKKLEGLKKAQESARIAAARAWRRGGADEQLREYRAATERLTETEAKIESLKNGLNSIGDDLDITTIFDSLGGVVQQSIIAGLDSKLLEKEFLNLINQGFSTEVVGKELSDSIKDSMATAFASGDMKEVERLLESVFSLEEIAELDPKVFEVLVNLTRKASGSMGGLAGNINAAVKSIKQLDAETSTYFQNFERSLFAKSSGANKEFNALALNIRNNVEALDKATRDKSTKASDLISNKDELKAIKQFYGIREDSEITLLQLKTLAADLTEKILGIEADAILLEAKRSSLKEQQKEIDARIARNADQRLKNLKEGQNLVIMDLKFQKDALQIDIRRLRLKQEQSKNTRDRLPEGTLARRQANANLAAMERTLHIMDLQEKTINTITESTKQRQQTETTLAVIQEAKMPLLEREVKIQGKIQLLKNRVTKSDAEVLNNLQEQHKLERQAIIEKEKLAQINLKEVKAKKEGAKASEVDVANAQVKVDLAKQERQQLLDKQLRQEVILKLSQEEKIIRTDLTVLAEESKVASAKIVRDNVERLQKLKQINSLQEQTLRINIEELRIAALKAAAAATNKDEQERILTAYAAQITSSRKLLSITEENNRIAESSKQIEIAMEALDATLETTKLEKQLIVIRNKQLFSLDSQQKLAKDTLDIFDAQFKIEKEKLVLEQELIQTQVQNKTVGQQQLDIVNRKLELLEEQYNLERQILDLDKRAREGENTKTIFSKEGIDLAFEYFELKARKAAGQIEPLFKTIGDGFYDTITGTFETAIDILLQGGDDFAYNVREAFKAGLRDVVGTALKNDMTKLFSSVGNILTGREPIAPVEATTKYKERPKTAEEKKTQIEERANLREKLQELIDKQGALGTVDSANRMTIDKLPIIADTLVKIETAINKAIVELKHQQENPTLPGEGHLNAIGMGQNNWEFAPPKGIGEAVAPDKTADILQVLKKDAGPIEIAEGQTLASVTSSPGIEQQQALLGTVFETVTKETGQITAGKLEAVVGAISLLSKLGGGGEGGGFFSQLFKLGSSAISANANGGIITGRSTGLTPFATGGVVNRPVAALIGEGKNSEAVVPLPNNREIPVDLKGSSGDTINIEQNFDFRNADTNAIATLRTQAKMIEERTFNRVFSEINKGGRYAKMVGRRR